MSFSEQRLKELCRKDFDAAAALLRAWPLFEQILLEAYAADLPDHLDARAYLEAMKHIRNLLDQARDFCPKQPGEQYPPVGPEPLYTQQFPEGEDDDSPPSE